VKSDWTDVAAFRGISVDMNLQPELRFDELSCTEDSALASDNEFPAVVFVLLSIGFECEFVGFIEVSWNDGEKRVFSNKPPGLVDSEEFFYVI